MQQNPLADALSAIKNAERVGKKEVIVKASKMIREILKIMQKHGYIGKYEFIFDGRGGKYRIELKGKIIDTNVISPRFSVKVDEFEKWEKRKLPARGVGLLILTTPKGILDHRTAKELHVGGKLLCYVY